MCKLFFGTQALPKNRGHVLTPDFGTVKNLFKMDSNGEVIFMKEFRIVDMNIFEVWVIAVRFHLEGRNYAQSTKILCSEYSLADKAPNTTLNRKMIYTGCLRLIETIDFDIKIVPIQVSMQKLEPWEYSPVRGKNWRAPPDTLSDG